MTALGVETAAWLSNLDFSGIVTAIQEAVPVVLAAIVPILGVRKVLSFVMGSVKGA